MKNSLSILVLFILSCGDVPEFEADNSFDPQNPQYTPPSVTLTSGPQNNEIVSSSTAAFSWNGNVEGMLFRYFFDGRVIREWDAISSAVIEYVDEGDHEFAVQGKYPTGDASDTLFVTFTVDAVSGPALLFSPRKHISPAGGNLSFDILAEEVDSLAAASLSIIFDPTLIKVDSVVAGQYIGDNLESIFYSDIKNGLGRVDIITALLGSSTPAFSGTGSLATIHVTVKSNGLNEIQFDGSETFRTVNDETISINTAIGAVIDQQ